MFRPILDFSKWSQVNESDYTKRLSAGEKIKLFEIDNKTFKVKIVSRVELVGADGKISPSDWNMLKTQFLLDSVVTAKYPGLKDLKSNVVVYTVERGSEGKDRVEMFTFAITPRAEAPGVPANVEYVKKEDLQSTVTDPQKAAILTQTLQQAQGKKVTDQETKVKVEPGDTLKLASPLGFDSIKSVKSDSPIFDLVDRAYFQLKKEPKIASLPFMNNLKAELKANQLGDSAVLFFKGIIAGYDLKDKYDDPLEVVNQTVIDKIMQMAPPAQNSSRKYILHRSALLLEKEVEVGASVAGPAGFNVDSFIKAVGGPAKVVSDIKLPEGGLVKGKVSAGDETLKAVQRLIIKKIVPLMGNDPVFAKFKSYGDDGKYGPTTAKVVELVKLGLGLKDVSGSTITQEMVDALSQEIISESYLDPFGRIQEQIKFNVNAASSAASRTQPTGKGGETSVSNKTWLEGIKSKLEGFGSVTVSKDEYSLLPNGWSKEDSLTIFKDKKVHWKSKNKNGSVSNDLSKITFDGESEQDFKSFIESSKLAAYTDSQLQSDVDELVDHLDGWVDGGNLKGILAIIQKYRNKKAIDDSDPDNPVEVEAVTRIMDLYFIDEGESLYDDVDDVGTDPLSTEATKVKAQILNVLSKYKKEDAGSV
jgi:hypothetical protein